MRSLDVAQVTAAVQKMVVEANCVLGQDMVGALARAQAEEQSPLGRRVIGHLRENAQIAAAESLPICQDTGISVFFVELGQDLHLTGGLLGDAIQEGVRRGYAEGYLRKSIVKNPFDRVNTGDNTPAVIHYDIVEGDGLKITFTAKGGGSENMSAVKMHTPADGTEGMMNFIVNHVKRSGANPCPPIIAGVGIGGDFEKSAILAKKALLRSVGEANPDPATAALERELLGRINATGLG
ncbi:MAG: fumarate hydratase, partial [Nitrospirota bacterium]|nr:fumarate hydratase [Nitrospirota bacterium]